jgi:hypothetical protein
VKEAAAKAAKKAEKKRLKEANMRAWLVNREDRPVGGAR